MQTLFKAKCAYLPSNGKSKGAFKFSVVAAYRTSEKDPKPAHRKFNIIFYPTREDLLLQSLGIDFSSLQKGRKESFIIPKCPYSEAQMKFILPNITRCADSFDELKQCKDRYGNLKENRFYTDDASGQYFVKESLFQREYDFKSFSDTFEGKDILLMDNGVDLFKPNS